MLIYSMKRKHENHMLFRTSKNVELGQSSTFLRQMSRQFVSLFLFQLCAREFSF
jgi:hypothetical protein